MSQTNVMKSAENKTIIMERTFPVPRKQVWDAWTDPRQLAKWWGPRGWVTTIKTFEFRPGGLWHYGMKCEDETQGEFYGQESWGKATFQLIREFETFSYVDGFSDAEGNPRPDMPSMTVTQEFKEVGGQTTLTSRTVFQTQEDYDTVINMGVEEGMTQTMDRLEEFVSSESK